MLHLALISLCLAGAAAGQGQSPSQDTPHRPSSRHVLQDLAWVPANAEIVAILDLEAAGRTSIGGRLLRRATDKPDIDVRVFDDFSRWTKRRKLRLGVDLRRIVIYGRPGEKTVPIAVAAMSPEGAGRLFDAKHRDEGAWSRVVDGRRVHSFLIDKDERAYAHIAKTHKGTAPVILCQDLNQLFGAIAIVEGKAKSLRGSDNPIARRAPPPGTLLWVVASDVGKISKKGPTSNLLKESSSLLLEIGEHKGEFFANAQIGGKSADSAENIADMAQGLIALGRLIARNEKTSKDVKRARLALLRGLNVTADGRLVKVRFRCAADKIADQLDRRKSTRGGK